MKQKGLCSPGCRNQFLGGDAGTNNELRRVQELPGRVFGSFLEGSGG